eukprot:TRINITY_DN6379_c0_g1_i2.p1 TRINITY_DN6379_c0_g1~~TRINITY_DN6379_c0_g1_i2.p1  ORF type:complete len:646 (-),score=113.34 TRINITY_DN6379_c0_g1_i2:128-2065(-)
MEDSSIVTNPMPPGTYSGSASEGPIRGDELDNSTGAFGPTTTLDDELLVANRVEINFTLRDIVITTLFIMFQVIFLLLFLQRCVGYIIFFISLMMENVYRMIAHQLQARLFTSYEEKLRHYMITLESFWLIAYKALVIFYIENHNFRLAFTLTPLFFYVIFRLYYCLGDKNRLECAALADFVIMIVRCFAILQLVLVYLKIEDVVAWEWKEVFWIYWFFFALMIGVVCGITFLLFSKICYFANGTDEREDIKVLLWLLILTAGADLVSCHGVWTLTDSLGKHEDPREQSSFITTVVLALLFLLVFLILTIVLRHTLRQFFERMASLDEGTSAMEDDLESPHDTSSHRRRHVKPKKKRIKKSTRSVGGAPVFLQRLSSTYFKIVDGINTKNRKNNFAKFSGSAQPEAENTSAKGKPQIPGLNLPQQQFAGGESLPSSARRLINSSYAALMSSRQSTSRSPIPAIAEEDLGFPSYRTPRFELNTGRGKSESVHSAEDIEAPKKCVTDQDIEMRDNSIFFNRTTVQRRALRFKLDNPLPITDFMRGVKQEESTPKNGEEAPNNPADQSVANCLVCFEKAPDAVVMNCGHGGLCYECAVDIWEKAEDCYLCRKPVVQILQVDLASKSEDVLKIVSYTDKVDVDDNSFHR